MESRLRPELAFHLAGKDLIDGRAARAASGVSGSGHQAAHCSEVPVSLSIQPRRDIVNSAEDVNVVLHRQHRREAGREVEIRACHFRNPVTLGDAVAVEPYDEARRDRRVALVPAHRGEGCAVEVEHCRKRRQSNPDERTTSGHTLQELATVDRHSLTGLQFDYPPNRS